MNTKKIWILALIFGLLTSIVFIIAISGKTGPNQASPTTTPPIEEEKTDEAENEEADEPLETTEEKPQMEIQEGMRAISIPVNEAQSVSSFVRPGSYVDVVVVLPMPIGDATTAHLLLQNKKVLAVGNTIDEKVEVDENGNEIETNEEPYYLVTLEVTPKEGASLTFARELGVYTLMLRGDGDESIHNVRISTDQMIEGSSLQ
ncbi:Flp pilus assembly protein CpaB [Bacillus sp. FJAT-45066]|uniref:Flp pilus assembly protein CpaB n=1 Tax=Bacillus sp. FJAT-45066 TaxID=2011010 RepID=UPI000BB9084B|nr:Flp pilus assembly protein CpaB [Bacillus sp. FJAT-45066]